MFSLGRYRRLHGVKHGQGTDIGSHTDPVHGQALRCLHWVHDVFCVLATMPLDILTGRLYYSLPQ